MHAAISGEKKHRQELPKDGGALKDKAVDNYISMNEIMAETKGEAAKVDAGSRSQDRRGDEPSHAHGPFPGVLATDEVNVDQENTEAD